MLVISGRSAAQVANDMELCHATVSGWVKIADEQGFDALWEAPRRGRSSKLSNEQYCELEEIATISKQIWLQSIEWQGSV